MKAKLERESRRRLVADQETLPHAKIHALPLMEKPQRVRFILMRPDATQFCPITQQPIAISGLDFAEAPFDLAHPDRNAIRLQCQHHFTANCLLYHWVFNDHILCPICRAGPANARLDVSRLPAHIKVPFTNQMFLSKPIEPWWFILHTVSCVIEGVNDSIRVSMYKHEFTDKLMVFLSNDIHEYVRDVSKIRLQMWIDSFHPITRFPRTGWIPMQDDFCIRRASYGSDFEYLVHRDAGTTRIAFLVNASLFRRIALDHDQERRDSLPSSDDLFTIRDDAK